MTLLAGAALFALVVSLAGCGGGGEGAKAGVTVTVTSATTTAAAQTGAPTSPSSSTPAGASGQSTGQATSSATSSLATAADAICARRDAEVVGLASAKSIADLAKVASTASRRAAIEQRALGELQRLTPPTGVAREWRKIVQYGEATLRRTRVLASLAKAHDVNAVRPLLLVGAATPLTVLLAASRSGLKQCYVRQARK